MTKLQVISKEGDTLVDALNTSFEETDELIAKLQAAGLANQKGFDDPYCPLDLSNDPNQSAGKILLGFFRDLYHYHLDCDSKAFDIS